MDKNNQISIITKDFGLRIIKLYKFLCDEKKEFILSKQIMRSGTSIGANIRESYYAQSKKDFISKLNIALKEAGETDYWLDVIHSADYFTDSEYESLKSDNDELLRLLVSIIKTAKQNSDNSL